MCLKMDEKLIGMGLTSADVPTPRVSALMRLKSQNCPQMSVHTSSHTHTHTRMRWFSGNQIFGSETGDMNYTPLSRCVFIRCPQKHCNK